MWRTSHRHIETGVLMDTRRQAHIVQCCLRMIRLSTPTDTPGALRRLHEYTTKRLAVYCGHRASLSFVLTTGDAFDENNAKRSEFV